MKVQRSEICFFAMWVRLAGVTTDIKVNNTANNPGWTWSCCGRQKHGFDSAIDAAVDALETLGIEVE